MTHNLAARRRIRKNHERTGGGYTVTFTNGQQQRLEVFPGRGRVNDGDWTGGNLEALEDAVAFCRDLGPDWKIVTLSNPGTIYADLAGRKGKLAPERQQLQAVGALDLLWDGTA